MGRFRLTYPRGMVMQALARGHRYGFEIASVVGLRPGSVYQVLRRLEEAGYVVGTWEAADEAHVAGRPPRRFYGIRPAACGELLEEIARRFPSLDDVPVQDDGVSGRAAGEGRA
jgi:DNA-binding PadR family transcriptional regulator